MSCLYFAPSEWKVLGIWTSLVFIYLSWWQPCLNSQTMNLVSKIRRTGLQFNALFCFDTWDVIINKSAPYNFFLFIDRILLGHIFCHLDYTKSTHSSTVHPQPISAFWKSQSCSQILTGPHQPILTSWKMCSQFLFNFCHKKTLGFLGNHILLINGSKIFAFPIDRGPFFIWNRGFCHPLCLGIIWKEPFLPTIPNYGLATGRYQLSGGRREAHLTSVLTGKAAICTLVQYYL